MNRLLLVVSFLMVAAFDVEGSEVDSASISKVNSLIIEIQKRFAPDKRTERFQAFFENGKSVPKKIETTIPEALAAFGELLSRENIKVDIEEVVLPSPDLHGKIYGVANLSVGNNRTTPDHAAEMATQTLLGTPVDILKKEGGYYLVRTPDRYLSWIETIAVKAMDDEEFKSWRSAEKVVFTAQYGHAFQRPSKKAVPVSDLVAGNILTLLGKEKKFYKVAYPDGRIGYVSRGDAVVYASWLNRPNPTADQIIHTAKSLLGVPYLWGGTSIKGVDCSGFTKMCFYLNGVNIPRDASQQVMVGQKVDIYEGDIVNLQTCLRNLQAGDLLFFAAGKDKRPNPRITHTAIYIGDGQFIQSAGMVRINSMIPGASNYDDFQSRTLVAAKRFLTVIDSQEVTRINNLPYYSTKGEVK